MRLDCGCPSEYPDWDKQDVDLSRHAAHVMPIPTLFHMPLSFESYLDRQWQEIQQLELQETWPGLVLTHTGFFRGRIVALVKSADSPSRRVETLPSPFRVRGLLHQGDIGTIKNSVRMLQSQLLDEGRMPKELYLCYLTCPRCSESRGGSRILLLRRWEQNKRLEDKVTRR